MVHLFFHQFFLVSNWNILDKSKFFSYTLKGEEFDGKVYFCKKISFHFFWWDTHRKLDVVPKILQGFCLWEKKNLPLYSAPFKV